MDTESGRAATELWTQKVVEQLQNYGYRKQWNSYRTVDTESSREAIEVHTESSRAAIELWTQKAVEKL